jgi:hypothetical protein
VGLWPHSPSVMLWEPYNPAHERAPHPIG